MPKALSASGFPSSGGRIDLALARSDLWGGGFTRKARILLRPILLLSIHRFITSCACIRSEKTKAESFISFRLF